VAKIHGDAKGTLLERLSSTVLSGRYRLESKLGSGGMSTVYLALDEVLDRPVAVKLLHREISEEADQLERFRREARAAARLSHPNLVGVIDAGEDDGRPYIVFEYIEGRTLKRRIQEEGGLPVDEAVAYAIEIGRGLTAAHARKLVHRDVKPQNVLIDPAGRAKVTDFGIARSLEQKGMTATGRVLGTTDYVSPEQAMGEDVDERSDVYSLGVVLYEMLTGDVPFQAETQVGVAMKHVNEPMPDVQAKRPEVSAAVASVVDRATTKDQRDRYGSVAQMVRDLEQTLEVEAARRGGTSGEATSVLDSVPSARRRLGRRRRAPWVGIAMGLAGIALIAAALLFGDKLIHNVGGGGGSVQGTEIPISSAKDFDPFGTGGEHPDEVSLAIDHNPTGTGWSTENYTGILDKPGVGIYVDTGKAASVGKVELRFAKSGENVEIRSAPAQSTAPESLGAWKVIGQKDDASTHTIIDTPNAEPSRFYLVWLTKLPENTTGLEAQVNDIRLISAP
jgi:serine/threonine protein kinase